VFSITDKYINLGSNITLLFIIYKVVLDYKIIYRVIKITAVVLTTCHTQYT